MLHKFTQTGYNMTHTKVIKEFSMSEVSFLQDGSMGIGFTNAVIEKVYDPCPAVERMMKITNGKHWYFNYDKDDYPYSFSKYFYLHNHSDFDNEDYRDYWWYFNKSVSKRRKGMVKFYSHGNGKRRRQLRKETMDDLPF